MKGAAQLLMDGADEYELETLMLIDNNVEKQKEIIDGAMELSALESVEGFDKEELDLKEVKAGASWEVQKLYDDAGMVLENRNDKAMFIEANPFIKSVFTNLLDNAAKYASDGKKVVLEAEDEGPSYKLAVRDYGPGIPDDSKDAVFDRFARKAKEGVKGSGLGLAIAKRIVDLHGGRIWVEDNSEGGSVFFVSLPKG